MRSRDNVLVVGHLKDSGLMPNARSRLADIEGPGIGSPLSEDDILAASDNFRCAVKDALAKFIREVECTAAQAEKCEDIMNDALHDIIDDATARQLREIEDGEE